MQLRINNVRIELRHAVSLRAAVAGKLGVEESAVGDLRLVRRAVDARRKQNVCLNYHVLAEVDLPQGALRRLTTKSGDVSVYTPAKIEPPTIGLRKMKERPVVIGAGPGGLITALELARHGYRPLLLERGKKICERVKDVERFWRTGFFNPKSNVQFGEGGAGTFSDGKLTTRVNDPLMEEILRTFVKAGAPEEILYEHKPHVGTDCLRAMVGGLTGQIVAAGGEIRYETQVTDFIVEDGTLKTLILNGEERLPVEAVTLATGHSARDTYAALVRRGVKVEAKAFAIGLRVEHPQSMIDRAQYGNFAGHPLLGSADYALVYHAPDRKRTAYSFCMCPGGQVVAAASEAGGVAVNGMSEHDRSSGVANSALVVNVTPEDFAGDPLGGIEFQRRYEQLAFAAGGRSYAAPAQSVSSFLRGGIPSLASEAAELKVDAFKISAPGRKKEDKKFLRGRENFSLSPGELQKREEQRAAQREKFLRLPTVAPSYRPAVKAADLTNVLPKFVTDTLKLGLVDFGKRIMGFDGCAGLLTGVETRTSSPLRIVRGQDYVSVSTKGLYPCGEGAGYAGGIMSAALDGYHIARAIMSRYKPFG